jgi:glycosyltransferase involved in cell wall biosynthesis
VIDARLKVSIITAVRNGEATIGTTLHSVARQTYPDIEHVIIDGASTDGTLGIIEAAGAGARTVVSEPDGGVYDAFNKGLRLATGDVVAFLNCGDFYASADVVARMATELTRTGALAVFGDLVIVDASQPDRVLRRYRSSRFRPSRVAYGFMPAHPTLFMRRRVYDEHGGFDASFRIAGDFELVARAFVKARISYSYIPDVLVTMPRGGLSTSGLKSNWIITREMYRACRQNAIATNFLKLFLRFPVKWSECWGVGKLAPGAIAHD